MLNQYIQFHRDINIDFLIKIAIGTLLICLLGPIVLRMQGELPITLQTLAILLISISFGWRVGLISTLFYVLAGIAGLPVFTGYNSGIKPILSANGGFYFGFITAALITGLMTEWKAFQKPLTSILLWCIGHAIILGMGITWVSKFNPVWQQILIDALPGALIKSAIGALTIQILYRIFRGRENTYS